MKVAKFKHFRLLMSLVFCQCFTQYLSLHKQTCFGKEEAESYTIVSVMQNAAGDICRKNNRATGYLEKEQ